MRPRLSQAELLAAFQGRHVAIYTRRGEAYGVRSYGEALQAYLQRAGIEAEVRDVGLLGLVPHLVRDRRSGGCSVLSTWHGAFAFLNRARSVFVLHGFPSADYRVGSFFVLWLVTLIAARLAWLVISNSTFTQAVNSKIFRIDSDAIWNPLRSGQVTIGFQDLSLRPRRVAFVGRAVPGKNVFEAATAFLRSDLLREWTMQVIGPVEDGKLARLASADPRLQLLGRLSHDDVLEALSGVRVVISLNPVEPYGFVYQEAAACGAVVVAPFLAGATEDLRISYSPRLVLLRELDLASIQEALERAAQRTEEAHLVA